MTTLNSFGFTRTRLDERLQELKNSMIGIFGSDIALDADTVDGQTLGIFAEAHSDLDQLAEDVYNSFNPQTATGVALSRVVQYNGIKRIEGIFTTADVLAVGTEGTVIAAGSLISSTTLNVSFLTIAEAIIPAAGQISIACRSSALGKFLAPANTLNKIDSPTFGWQTVTNPLDAVPGRNEETDAQLRIRRRASTSTPAQAVIDAVYGALLNLANVLKVKVYENDQDIIQPVTNLPPHSIYCVVEGGALQTIADTIWAKKSAGVTLVGALSQQIADSQGNPHTIKFSRPVDLNVFIVINLSIRAGWPTDGVQRIKDALLAWALDQQDIGEEVIQSRLFDPVNTIPGHSVQDIFIGTAAAPATENNVAVNFEQLARFDSTRITVNII